jgi:hypothetical protein
MDRIDREIGPGYYYAKDDLVKPKVLGFKIVEPADPFLKEFNEIDRRLPLDIHYDLVDKRVPGGKIDPEPKNENPLKFLDIIENTKTVRAILCRDLAHTTQTTTQS